MKEKKWSKYMLIVSAIVMLWIKTYIVYKTSFDITIENGMQEFILFINPLSSALLFIGLALFSSGKMRNGLVVFASFLAAFVLFANVVYYRFFTDFITIPVLFQTSNMGDLGGSIFELIRPVDILMFIDTIILALIVFKGKVSTGNVKLPVKLGVVGLAVLMFFVNLSLSEGERSDLLTRTFDREILVKNIGTYNYHIYDAVLQSKTKAQRAFADSSQMSEVENYVRANQKKPNEDLFGAAKGKNVILISMESTQSFVINNKINGEEITPFLNDLIEDSYYFENFYHQTGQGKTSDAEFLIDNSLYPMPRGAVFFTHSQNEYNASPEILKNNGYYSAVFHANNKSFWNRDIMYNAMGYDKYFSLRYYDVNEENSVGWGLKDKEFFDQSVEMMKDLPQPFYTKFLSLTNHFPFELHEEDKMVDEFNSNSRTLNRYFPTVRYTDEALKHFFQRLKDEGLYEDSVIIIYGDHYGISENHNTAMGQFLGRDITPFESVQLQRVPFIIHIPGHEDDRTISTVSGQIDIKPTILHLLGIETNNDIQLGTDLFSPNKQELTVLRDGSFITKDYVYTDNTCYDKATGDKADGANCEPFLTKAKQELQYSDEIIYGDLLRFIDDQRENSTP
ncbi:LTA synthase family protein [Bacillus marinisedimentorum]|uniref:LTA synthase family protein n=1 Tax=Bacillus marinisedimentorum TaxID=1821260 RepID=UPI000871D12A|nr:LTA synthase family protein [Bacillus marinisedimentorum]